MITLASMLRVPVSIHNVEDEKYTDRTCGQVLEREKIKHQQITERTKNTDRYINN